MVAAGWSTVPAMTPKPTLADHLRRLEEELLRPEVRRSRAALEALLAPEFLELGSSGRAYDRAAIVAALAVEVPAAVRIEDFAVRELTPDVALVTYRSVRSDATGGAPTAAWRSSIWCRAADGGWQLTFHQGTPTA